MGDPMSERFGCYVYYRVPFEAESIRTALEAVRRAVDESWERHRDRLSPDAPPSPVDVEAWLARIDPERMRRLYSGKFAPWPETGFAESAFSFSPLSNWVCSLKVIKLADDCLEIGFTLAQSASSEVSRPGEYQWPPPGSPEPWDDGYDEWMEVWNAPHNVNIWSVSKQCLLHIVDRLAEALPVDKVSIDERLT
jgi:hypothetical protein